MCTVRSQTATAGTITIVPHTLESHPMETNQANTVQIPLTQGLFATIDAADLHIVQPYRWRIKMASRTSYAQASILLPSGRWAVMMMHRLILGLGRGDYGKAEVDHIDSDGLNNSRGNLRICTRSENSMNQRKRSDNSSGIAGVYLDANSGKWRVRIEVDGKRISLGLFASKDQARSVRLAAAAKYHGAFARLGS